MSSREMQSHDNGTHRRAKPRRETPAFDAGAPGGAVETSPYAAFEEAVRQLEEAAQALEDGHLPLDQTVALFERGIRLARQCQEILDRADLHVRQLVAAADGSGEDGFDTVALDLE